MTLPVDHIEPSGDEPAVASDPAVATSHDDGAQADDVAAKRPQADRFEAAGRQIAAVLRTAEEEGTRIREQAEVEAEAIRSAARADAVELRGDAEADRAEAKVLLIRARERADQLVIDAEQRIAAAVREAENEARTRVTTVLDAARQRLEHLARDEHEARERMLAAQTELQAVIHRIAHPPPVIDLRVDEPTVRFGLAPDPVRVALTVPAPSADDTAVPAPSADDTAVPAPSADDTAVPAPSPTGRRRTDRPAGPVTADAVSTTDSLSTMVRGAVDRAQDTAGEQVYPTSGHPHLAALSDPGPSHHRTDGQS